MNICAGYAPVIFDRSGEVNEAGEGILFSCTIHSGKEGALL